MRYDGSRAQSQPPEPPDDHTPADRLEPRLNLHTPHTESRMLSRTADHLFWMARYMERAENTARLLDVNYQTSLLPQSEAAAMQGWKGLLGISELTHDYQKRFDRITAHNVMSFMVDGAETPHI